MSSARRAQSRDTRQAPYLGRRATSPARGVDRSGPSGGQLLLGDRPPPLPHNETAYGGQDQGFSSKDLPLQAPGSRTYAGGGGGGGGGYRDNRGRDNRHSHSHDRGGYHSRKEVEKYEGVYSQALVPVPALEPAPRGGECSGDQ